MNPVASSVILVGGGEIALGDRQLAPGTPMSHAEAVNAVGPKHARLHAIVESDPKRREALAARGLPVSANLDEVPYAKHEIIVLCTPSNQRENLALAALARSPRYLVTEKPLADNLHTARIIVDAAKHRAVPLYVNFNRRTDPRVQAALDSLSKVRSIVVCYARGLSHYASHAIDLLLSRLGEVHSVQWTGSPALLPPPHSLDISLSFNIHFNSGVCAHFVGHEQLDYDLFDLHFYCAHELVSLLAGGAEICRYTTTTGVYYSGYNHLLRSECDLGPVAGFTELYLELCNATPSVTCERLCSGAEALRVAQIIATVEQSRQAQGRVMSPTAMNR